MKRVDGKKTRWETHVRKVDTVVCTVFGCCCSYRGGTQVQSNMGIEISKDPHSRSCWKAVDNRLEICEKVLLLIIRCSFLRCVCCDECMITRARTLTINNTQSTNPSLAGSLSIQSPRKIFGIKNCDTKQKHDTCLNSLRWTSPRDTVIKGFSVPILDSPFCSVLGMLPACALNCGHMNISTVQSFSNFN